MTTADTMSIECRTCPVRELRCGDCMVPIVLSLAQAADARRETSLDPEERAVVTGLVRAGLIDAGTAARARVVLGDIPARTSTTWAAG